MNFNKYASFWEKIFRLIPFNAFDYVILVSFALYIFEDASFGAISSLIGLSSTILAFFIGLAFYHPVSNLLLHYFSLTKGFSDALSFLGVVVVSFGVISAVLAVIRRKYISLTFPKKVDMVGGAIFGSISFFFIAAFAVALLLSFPVSNLIKNAIKTSVTGQFFSSRTQGLESYVRQIFGGAIEDTINFLTVEPNSNDSVALNFKTNSATVDELSENQMLHAVNEQRQKAGLASLAVDDELRLVAEAHARDMLVRGYFSHYTPEGFSPFDRMEAANITYQYAGENLAFAPDVEIAMDGLMKSPGHRANILSPNFKKAGIGVLDAGFFGKMFVQEFTD